MEILNEFGFNIQLFIAQIVNFLVIAFIFKKFAYKPLLEAISKRNSAIKKGLADAEKAQKALEEAESKKDEILQNAEKEAGKIILSAKNDATKVREELIETTKRDVEKMMAQTKEQIVLEREEFMKEAKNLSIDLANTILQSTLEKLFDKKEQKILLEKGVKMIKNEKPKN